MNFQTVQYQFDTILRKLQASSLFLHQALYALLKRRGRVSSRPDERLVRHALVDLRADPTAFTAWQLVAYRQCPYLEEACHYACLLHYRLMTSTYTTLTPAEETAQAFPHFWQQLFDHLLELAFIHPQFFMDHDGCLARVIAIIQEAWSTFVAVHVKCSFEYSSWTTTNVQQHQTPPPPPPLPPLPPPPPPPASLCLLVLPPRPRVVPTVSTLQVVVPFS
jgi:hypothetical protein